MQAKPDRPRRIAVVVLGMLVLLVWALAVYGAAGLWAAWQGRG